MIVDDDLYWYRVSYLKNHDGDTVTVVIDVGYNMSFKTDIRMYGINTPELQGVSVAKGKEAQRFLETLLTASKDSKLLRMKSFKDQNDKYGGRVLGELWLPVTFRQEGIPASAIFDAKGTYTNLNQLLVSVGLARPYFGAGEKV